MNEEMNLSRDELSALLGDSVEMDSSDNGLKSLDSFKESLTNAKDKVAQVLAQKLGEEVTLNLALVEESRGLVATGNAPWYVSKGNVNSGAEYNHYFVFPSDLAQQLVSQFLKIDDVANDLTQVGAPLLEISEGIVNAIKDNLERDFSASLGEYESSDDVSSIAGDDLLVKIEWNLGKSSFYEYYSASILDIYNTNTSEASDSSEDDFLSELSGLGDSDNSAGGMSLGDLGLERDDSAPSKSSSADNGILGGLGSDEDESLTLGDALLGLGSQTVSNVKMPSFEGEESVPTGDTHNSINLLKDVTMDVTVELGSTKKLIGEILELNRGSIIELKKLAGEPLDVKINNKLIARGEVVVIDEYFGVRIIEVVSPYKKPTSK